MADGLTNHRRRRPPQARLIGATTMLIRGASRRAGGLTGFPQGILIHLLAKSVLRCCTVYWSWRCLTYDTTFLIAQKFYKCCILYLSFVQG
jgi:hypothetical protein